jgi:hypothetical protein
MEVLRDARVVFHGGVERVVARAHLRHVGVDVQDGVEGGVGSPELPEVQRGVADLFCERLEGPGVIRTTPFGYVEPDGTPRVRRRGRIGNERAR